MSTNDYVHVLTLDFTKAFDTVRHATMMAKMSHLSARSSLQLDRFLPRALALHKVQQESVELAEIFASVIQGSGLGPAAFLVTAADLRPVHDGNDILKYADDTYLVSGHPAANTYTSSAELAHIEA